MCWLCLGEDGLLRYVVEGGPRSHHQLALLTKLQPGLQHNSESGTISVVRYTVYFFMQVLRIQIRRIHMIPGLLDPDPLVRDTDPNPDP
jgi:hypothetical protein